MLLCHCRVLICSPFLEDLLSIASCSPNDQSLRQLMEALPCLPVLEKKSQKRSNGPISNPLVLFSPLSLSLSPSACPFCVHSSKQTDLCMSGRHTHTHSVSSDTIRGWERTLSAQTTQKIKIPRAIFFFVEWGEITKSFVCLFLLRSPNSLHRLSLSLVVSRWAGERINKRLKLPAPSDFL